MFIDLTTKITPKMVKDAQGNEKKALVGHLGTHFDVMNKAFPLEYLSRNAIIFDVRNIRNRDIDIADISLDKVEKDMFVLFYSNFIEEEGYGSKYYFENHPQLSNVLIDCLAEKQVSIIGVDFAGVRRGIEHTPKDQYLADKNIFVVENLCNLESVLKANSCEYKINTYPVNYLGMTGLPCRVVAEL
jgi:kynurenine formamidase